MMLLQTIEEVGSVRVQNAQSVTGMMKRRNVVPVRRLGAFNRHPQCDDAEYNKCDEEEKTINDVAQGTPLLRQL